MRALDSVDLLINNGEFVTLLGPSGCGKTTMLNLLAGFLPPDDGTIRIDDRVVSKPGHVVPPQKRGMGMVFQSYALWPHKTVYKNVAYGLQRQKRPKAEISKRVEQMLDIVGLSSLGDRYPGQLSGGQQQRVALARSLVTEPSILLLDEPLSNLDAKLRESMRFEVQEIQRRLNTTFIYVTHDQVEALAVSDRIAVFSAGRVHQYDAPREVYSRPSDAFVADFMGSINFLAALVTNTGESALTVQLGADHACEIIVDPAPSVDGIQEGDATVVALRPESFRIGLGNDRYGPNILQNVTVVHSTPLGNITQLHVRAGEEVLRVQSDGMSGIGIGDVLALEIPEGHGRAFSVEEAGSYLTAQRNRRVHVG